MTLRQPAATVVRTWLLPALLGLAACAQLPSSSGERFTGRLALRVDGDAERSVSGGFELSGDAEQGELRLTTPLGTTAAQARWRPGEALLNGNGPIPHRFATLDQLTAATLGEPLPMAALFDWLHGRPWPRAASVPRADGEPGFEQLGWQVGLSRWSEGWLDARRSEPPPGVTLRIRLDRNPS